MTSQNTTALHLLLDSSARRFANRVAIEGADVPSLTYADLASMSDRLRDQLRRLGVVPGDRVGICLHKSADAIAALFGIMKAGAAYVPVDPKAPASRSAYIFQDCGVSAVVVEKQFVAGLTKEFERTGFAPTLVMLEGTGGGGPLRDALEALESRGTAPASQSAEADPERLAYILYTSGSTGKPKGVMLSHGNAACFVDWCSEVFEPSEKDRFSSHAPLHFDLSILDVFVCIKHGATLVIVDEELGKDPARLGPWIADKRITIWYSAPSILGLITQYGQLHTLDLSHLRMILFAGEVFPLKHLRKLKALIPHARYFNLYGPTETNVCTWYEVPQEIPAAQTEPAPIGRACSHCRLMVVDDHGKEVPHGTEGMLCVAGPSVLRGYWNLEEHTASAFLPDRQERWYRTGDVVAYNADGNLRFLGRRDRMVKKRGYRIELGEIEAALLRHPKIGEAAVVSLTDDEAAVRINAFVSTHDGTRLSLIELKTFCSQNLPLYMVPDSIQCLGLLPKTSTDKTDYRKLVELSCPAPTK